MDELIESRDRLAAANIAVAVQNDGRARFAQADVNYPPAAQNDGWTVYTAADMYQYIHLPQAQRRQLHAFKSLYGGTIEWKAQEEPCPTDNSDARP